MEEQTIVQADGKAKSQTKVQAIDIHNFSDQEQKELQRIARSTLSEANRKVLYEYNNQLVCIANKAARRIKELQTLRSFAERIQKDYSTVSTADLQAFVTRLTREREAGNISIWTQYDYQKIIKKFYKWLVGQSRSTADATWIKARMQKKDRPRLARAEFLLEDDVKQLIEKADNPRDQALIAILWDYGARIGEIGSLRWQDIQFDVNGGMTTKLSGKTGTRTPWAIDSVPHIKRWHATTPFREPTNPIWLANDQFKTKTYTCESMSYSGLYNAVRRIFRKSGITTFERIETKTNVKEKYTYVKTGGKNCNPHLFRHSRALWAALQGWTQNEANVFFGWAHDSNMFADYIAMCDDDAKRKMMETRGLLPNSRPPTPKYQYCPACNTPNNPSEKWCSRCHALVDLKEHQRQQEQMALSIAALVRQQVLTDIGKHDLQQFGAHGYTLNNSVSGGQVAFHDRPIGRFMSNQNWAMCQQCKQCHSINDVHICEGANISLRS